MKLRHIFWENKVKYVKVVMTIHSLKYKMEIKSIKIYFYYYSEYLKPKASSLRNM